MKTHGHSDATVRLFAEKSEMGVTEVGLAFDRPRNGDVEIPADGLNLVADALTLDLAKSRLIDYGTEGFTFARNDSCESHPFTE